MIYTNHQILLGGQVKKDEVGGAYSMYGSKEKCIQGEVGKSKEV